MTLDEAKKIASIARWVDGGCSTCVESIVDDLTLAFPEYKWIIGEYGDDGALMVSVELNTPPVEERK